MLKTKIRAKLIETKEKKDNLLIEQRLMESRIMMIVGSTDNTKNFRFLSESKQQKMMYSLLNEINYLDEQGMLNEQLMDFLQKIFGNFFGGAVETIVEPLVNSVLGSIGLGNGYFEKFLVSFITTSPLKLAKALKSCEALTSLVAESLSEAMVMMIMQDKGLSGTVATFLRNSLGGAIKDTKFIQSLEKGLTGFVCPLFDKFNDNASGVYDKLKTKTTDSGGLGGLLDKGKSANANLAS